MREGGSAVGAAAIETTELNSTMRRERCKTNPAPTAARPRPARTMRSGPPSVRAVSFACRVAALVRRRAGGGGKATAKVRRRKGGGARGANVMRRRERPGIYATPAAARPRLAGAR